MELTTENIFYVKYIKSDYIISNVYSRKHKFQHLKTVLLI